MSPQSNRSPLLRERLIRTLAKNVMDGFKLTRPQAIELLASLSPDDRRLLFSIRGVAMAAKTNQTRRTQ